MLYFNLLPPSSNPGRALIPLSDLRRPRHSIFEVIKVFLNGIAFWFNQGMGSSSYDVLKVHPCKQDPYWEWVCKSNLFKSNKVSLFCSITQSCLILCDLLDCSPPGSSVHRISQARILEWVFISYSRGFSRPRNWTRISCVGRQVVYHCTTWEALASIICWLLIYTSLIH